MGFDLHGSWENKGWKDAPHQAKRLVEDKCAKSGHGWGANIKAKWHVYYAN